METEKRYDMKTQEWRKGNFKHLDRWRSTKKAKCQVCGAESDEWVMILAWWNAAPRLVCPNFKKDPDKHNKLQEEMWRKEGLF